MKIAETTETRMTHAEAFVDLLEQTAAAYHNLQASTADLKQAIFPFGKRFQNGVPMYSEPVHGLDNLTQRVTDLVQFKLFGTGQGSTVDIIKTIENEHKTANNLEVTNV